MKKEKKSCSIWYWIIAILILLSIFSNSNFNQDYKNCVDGCRSSHHSCIHTHFFFIDYEGFITTDDSMMCASRLENCLRECGR